MDGAITEARGDVGQISRQLTVSERLENEENQLVKRLEQIRAIRHSLSNMPEVQKVIDGLSALGQFHY
jgi:ABC-type phosphate/phosphonate transport system ATPase subunit